MVLVMFRVIYNLTSASIACESLNEYLQYSRSKHIFSWCLSVCLSDAVILRSPRWQVTYQKKARNTGNVQVILLRPHSQQVLRKTPKLEPHTICLLQIGKREMVALVF